MLSSRLTSPGRQEGPRELAVRPECLPAGGGGGGAEAPKTAYLLLWALTAPSPAAGLASPAAKTVPAAKRQHKGPRKRTQEPTHLPVAGRERGASARRERPSHSSLLTLICSHPKYLRPSFPNGMKVPWRSPPRLAVSNKAVVKGVSGLGPPLGAGWGALLVCAPTGFSLSA